MAINIKDPDVDRMVRKLADMTGEKMTEVVRKAVQERHDREMHHIEDKIARVNALLAELDEETKGQEKPSSNHDWFYDENGLPI